MKSKEYFFEKIKENYLQDKTRLYELSKEESNILDLSAAIVRDLYAEMDYIQKENKRLLNENINLADRCDELEDRIKELKKKSNEGEY
jgi:predicted transcriptional regulator